MSLAAALRVQRPDTAIRIDRTPYTGPGLASSEPERDCFGRLPYVVLVTVVTIRDGQMYTGCDSIGSVYLADDEEPTEWTAPIVDLLTSALLELDIELLSIARSCDESS